MAQTIASTNARQMIDAGAIRGASIIGTPGGWSVMLKIGMTERPLGTQRTDKPRQWRSLDTCIDYLKTTLHLVRFDLLDASNYSAHDVTRPKRADAAERMKAAHAAVAHDAWFRAEVEQAITEADDPATEWISHEEASASWAKKRAQLAKRVAGGA
ncbi:MAG: hypothetical protein IPG34_07445 [Rhodocyclaceae bacterium]|nr:hypothetical protein [Rhodocyclaceae bacterium]